jgi:hypothetical protein
MKHHRIGCMLIISLTCLIVTGCAAFRGGEPQQPTTWPLSKGPGKQSISLVITGEGIVNGQKADVHRAAISAWEQSAEKAYKDSGLFSDIKMGAADTDLRAEIHVIDRGEASTGLAFLSGFTMTLIPAKASGEYVVKTVLKNKGGEQLGSFEKKEPMTFWIQLFLIFIMPFNWPNTVATESLYDLNRATVIQAYNAGLLARSHQGQYESAYVISE